jgi:hypothetical protein
MAGIFGGIKSAKSTEGGLYFAPGDRYVVEIQRIKSDKTRKGIAFFVVECKVLHAYNGKMAKGVQPSWMVTLDKDAALGNIKQFVEAVMEVDMNQISDVEAEQSVEMICGPDQPLAGQIVVTETWNKPTQAGKDFTRHKWLLPTQDDYKAAGLEAPKAAAAG